MFGLYEWLAYRCFRVHVDIQPGIVDAKPQLCCGIHNNSRDNVTIEECHLIVDGNQSSVNSWNLPLPQTFTTRNGGVFCFPAQPILTTANELRQKSFKVQALFRDNTGKTYLSKPIKIETQARGVSIFEDQYERKSEAVRRTLQLAQELAEQLDQQLVGIPHVLLGLTQEQIGVGGYVLRELGVQQDYLIALAKSYPNMPRDNKWPHPHLAIETHNLLDEFMSNEARKMRQKLYGTGHLLLGLAEQRNQVFLTVLKHLGIQPRTIRNLTYQRLWKYPNLLDHPTPPPKGIKRIVWAAWYSVTHMLLKAYARIVERFYPNLEV